MKKIFSLLDTRKKKASVGILCCALIFSLSTGIVFAAGALAADANTDAKPIVSITAVSDTSPSVIAEQYANRFEKYKDYGLTYDKAIDKLYFDGKLVRYFEDYYPVGDNGYAGVDYFNENGTVDVHGVRDLTQIVHNADGSYDPSGKLVGVEQYSQAEFDARDIDSLKNPPQSLTAIHADNDISYIAPQVPQQGNNTTNTATTDIIDNGGNNQGQASNATTYAINENVSGNKGETFAEIFLNYKSYDITFDENSINGGIGNVYYQGQLVKTFIDEKPNGGVFMLTSSDGGIIKVRTVYDDSGKLTGVKVVED